LTQSDVQYSAVDAPVPRWRRVVDAVGAQNLSLLAALGILVAIFGTAQPETFFQPRNLTNILNAVAILGLIASAQTIVIISGAIDISVGSIVGVAGVAAAMAMAATNVPAIGITSAVVVGTACGVVNGLLVTKGRVNPIIATLATMAIFRGLAYVLSNGRGIGIVNPDYNWIGSGRIASIPVAVFVFLIVAVILVFFMRSTDIGRNIYAIGGNPNAAKLVGINVQRYQAGVYVLTGLVCGIAAVLLTARTTSGQPASGSEGLELEAITAAFLGGCAMAGGRGTIVGTIIGVLIIGTLNNGMILMQVPSFYQLVAKGLLLLGAVMLMEFRTAKRD
jgi:ribose transport system permease protein/L-arabinose transport system permease protein